ncbi:hypothetical protein ACFY3N_31690 [Streptomyces sp. NPDC000348]|uniref:hypothetical protein n=1 Tax=Streptomyces sp. NPDC000348 TaxID=3364538 RepID=UPI00368B4707
MSDIPLSDSATRNVPVGGRRRASTGCRADGPTTVPTAAAPAYTADSARLAAAALMRLFMDRGVPGFGFAGPEDPEDEPGTGGRSPAAPAGATGDRGAAGPEGRAAKASTTLASGPPETGRAATARSESPSALRRRRRAVRSVRRGLLTDRTQAEEGRHGRYVSATPPTTVPGGPAVVHGTEEER